MQTAEIEQDIRRFLVENFMAGRGEELRDDEPLLGNVIDSSGVIELVVFLEEHFAIGIADEEVVSDNLETLRNVVEFIERKLGSRGQN
jgi:acyl carrier protein